MLPMVALCFWMGVQPNAFLKELDGSIDALVVRIDEAGVKLANLEALEGEATAALPLTTEENLTEVSR